MATFEPLKGISGVFDSTLNNDIQDGLVEYFDWALLTKGNYFNVAANETSPNGEDMSRLRLSTNDSYTAGQVWEGFRKNWVWQSGISVNGFSAPLVGTNNQYPGISGVYVDGAFHPTSGAGAYAHHVDYFNGRVIFDSAIPTGSVAIAESQTGIYPSDSPGGWRIIGRTPIQLFNFSRSKPALLLPGDLVRFQSLDNESEFELIKENFEKGDYALEEITL